MNVFDIILGLPLLFAAYKGFREGVVVQLGGIAGIILGIFVAFRYGMAVGGWFGLDGVAARVAGFLIIILAFILCLALVGRLVKGIFRIAGLGALDSLGGVVLGVLKMGLLLSVLLIAFEALNSQQKWVAEERTESSVLYKPVRSVAGMVFPYVDFVKEKLL